MGYTRGISLKINENMKKEFPYMSKALFHWGEIISENNFDLYVNNLVKSYPANFENKARTIINNFLQLEESVADYDLYHRHGIISAQFISRLINHFPKYSLTDNEKFEMLTAALIHDCEYNKKTIHDTISKFFLVHCNHDAFSFIYKNSRTKIENKITIGKLIKETIYKDGNKWLNYSPKEKKFVLGSYFSKKKVDEFNKRDLKRFSVVLADIIGQLNASGHDKMVKEYLCKLNPNISTRIPKGFIDLYDKMCEIWDVNKILSNKEIERFEGYKKNTD